MIEPFKNAEAMRRKRYALAALVAALLALMALLYFRLLGPYAIPLGWAALIGGVICANRIMSCPSCGRRLASILDKVCAHCGAVLSDEPTAVPAAERRLDAGGASYMEESRRILRRWGDVRALLGKLIWGVGAATAAAILAVAWGRASLAEGVFLAAFVGLAAAAVFWLILVHVVDNLFGVGFMVLRGRCPACRAWFNPPASLGPGSLHMDYSLPSFCASCRAKLD